MSDLTDFFTALPADKKALFLARVAHVATISARAEGYVVGTDDADGVILRKFNEFIHRVTGYIVVVLTGGELPGQDASVMEMIIAQAKTRAAREKLASWLNAGWTEM